MFIIDNKYYVYGWKRKDTNSYFYIGKGKGKRCNTIQNRSKHFINIINHCECYVEIIINNISEQEAFKIEKEYIEKLVFEEGYSIEIPGFDKKEYHLVNQCWGGEGGLGNIPKSPETKIRLSKSRTGKCIGEENFKSIPVVLLNTLEKFESINLAQQKYKAPRIMSCCLGKNKYSGKNDNGEKLSWVFYEDYIKMTKEDIDNKINEAKFSRNGDNNGFSNKKHSKQSLEKMSNSKIGDNNPMFGKHKTYNSRSVYCVELNRTFDSVKLAIKTINEEYNVKLNCTSVNKILNKVSKKDWYGKININGEEVKLHWRICDK